MIPTNEQETIAVFAQLANELGYKFKEMGTRCPDAILQKDGQLIRAEFEFKSKNFQRHNHAPEDVDIVICWSDDWPSCPLPVLSLENYIAFTHPMSRWERFWAWWSSLWLTRIRYMADVRETRRKERSKEFCEVCGALMISKCTSSGFNEKGDYFYNEVNITCPQCGYCMHYETWKAV